MTRQEDGEILSDRMYVFKNCMAKSGLNDILHKMNFTGDGEDPLVYKYRGSFNTFRYCHLRSLEISFSLCILSNYAVCIFRLEIPGLFENFSFPIELSQPNFSKNVMIAFSCAMDQFIKIPEHNFEDFTDSESDRFWEYWMGAFKNLVLVKGTLEKNLKEVPYGEEA